MQLIGMLDSPYVRRVAVSLQLLGLPFEHRSVSVFRGATHPHAGRLQAPIHYAPPSPLVRLWEDKARTENRWPQALVEAHEQKYGPVVKAPTLVCDDGTVLMDSTLIIDYAEALAATRASARRSLVPAGIAERQHALRVLGLALAACEKSVQIVYERAVRPAEKMHQPWVDRVTNQLVAACGALEAEIARRPLAATSAAIDQAGLTTAVVWHFIQALTPEPAPASAHPHLQAHAQAVEQLPAFIAAPHGEGVYRP